MVTGWWEERRPGKSGGALAIPAPRLVGFDRAKHGILEEELKQLYTAVTRARVRVAVYDADEEKRRPVFS